MSDIAHSCSDTEQQQPRFTLGVSTTTDLTAVAIGTGPDRAMVQLEGECDLTTAGLLADALAEQRRQGRRFVHLDLSRLSFLDCAGLGILVLAHNEFRSIGGTLVLVGVGPRVAKVLEITHLDEALLIAEGPGESHHGRSYPEASRRVRHLAGVPGQAEPA